MFTRAVVRTPGRSLSRGLSTAGLGPPDHARALAQHREYVGALEDCGLDVLVLEPDEGHPDSTFVEDVAVVRGDLAVLTRPGAPSRRGEVAAIRPVLEGLFRELREIRPPGTLDGGDVMMTDSRVFIGLSERTDGEGARQLARHLREQGLRVTTIPVGTLLHLKSGVAFLGEGTLLACGELVGRPEFRGFRILEIDPSESYAANCIRVNGTVLVPAGFPQTRSLIEGAGFTVREVGVSEFRKVDGGLSCLSLRF